MHSLIFDQVSFAYSGGDELLRDISFTCAPGWTALVGDNGAGKTTLLSLAAGALVPARGHVRRVNIATIALVAQRVDAPDDAINELAWSFDREALRWRSRLGLGDDDIARWDTLSPGERKRWQLAAALVREPDVLIVDEPSNHLDATAMAQVGDALAAYAGVGIIVSHDRELLDRLAYQTVRVQAGRARAWPGGYSSASEAWRADAASAQVRRDQLAGERRKAERQLADARRKEESASRMMSTSARMRNKDDSEARAIGAFNLAEWAAAGAGRQVQRAHGRVAAARTAEASVVVAKERGAPIAFRGETAARRWVIQLDVQVLRAGDKVLARDLHLALGRDERVWLRGDNGAGKTTLIGVLLQACTLPPERVFALPQDLSAEAGAALAAELRGLDAAARGRLGQIVDALGVDPGRALESASPSPGETRKLALALGLVREPQLLVLDEPTNHLDLASIERLEAALSAFPGALVLVTHDRRFAEALCEREWVLQSPP